VLVALKAPALFNSTRLGEWGDSVCFGDDENLELAADNLRSRAVEQAGQVSHEFLQEWMHHHSLTQQAAADALGLSRRILGYYLRGARPMPRTVALLRKILYTQDRLGGNRALSDLLCEAIRPAATPPAR